MVIFQFAMLVNQRVYGISHGCHTLWVPHPAPMVHHGIVSPSWVSMRWGTEPTATSSTSVAKDSQVLGPWVVKKVFRGSMLSSQVLHKVQEFPAHVTLLNIS